MAFSFRAGTNWCHDFPKLARESGFYFNMHAARVRVDWNRISSIDVDRVIRERDFQIVDENVNNVIDYHLESEYDVKILDPSFVKLFRLAQLAVEYLLYCKQYLDQSVVILKEELKYKIEENVKLKDETMQLQNSIKDVKEKLKDKNKSLGAKSDIHGEIHKCPYCPKTFMTASFANAHLMRRHSNILDILSSPVNEHYRSETEKLHNEIKTLKERLNQTERVIRNESNKLTCQSETLKKNKLSESPEDSISLQEDKYRRYKEEMNDLKTMFFAEIRNIKRKENNLKQNEIEGKHENIKELLNQQENEIERLKNQLQEQLTSNKNEVEVKLSKQEEYWKSKIEKLENQHCNDIENLFSQMKMTLESTKHMKAEYEGKVSYLEQQSIDQSKLLTVQSEQLKTLTKGIQDSKKIKPVISEIKKLNQQIYINAKKDINDNESNQYEKQALKKYIKKDYKQSPTNLKNNLSYSKFLRNKKIEQPSKTKVIKEPSTENKVFKQNEKKHEKEVVYKKLPKTDKKYSILNESEGSESCTNTDLDTEFDEETVNETNFEATQIERTFDEESNSKENKVIQPNNRFKKCSSAVLEMMKNELQKTFDCRLKDLGIDPEWNTIPIATFKDKMESIRHRQNISCKKYPQYEQIHRKLLEELFRRISLIQKSSKKEKLEKKSFLNQAMKNVKSKALKAFHEFKIQKNNDDTTIADTSTSVSSSTNSTPRESQIIRRLSLELLPKKPTQLDFQELKQQVKVDLSKKHKPEQLITKTKINNTEDKAEHTSKEPIAEPSKYTKQEQHSNQCIEEFLKDIQETPKKNIYNTKMVQSPLKTTNSILQDTSFVINDTHTIKHDSTLISASPKNNKSVLKSTCGSMGGGSVKKKVIFDLEDKDYGKKSTISQFISELGEDEYKPTNEKNEMYWDFPSTLERKEKITLSENSNNENIQLKTSQSKKIAEISRKIQEKLETSRRKPVGSVEAMFSSKTFSIDNQGTELIDKKHNFIDIVDPASSYLTSQVDNKTQNYSSHVPVHRQLF